MSKSFFQFYGEQAYFTVCKKCGHTSKNPTSFSELELQILVIIFSSFFIYFFSNL